MSHIIVGVMGPGDDARPDHIESAYELGRLIGQEGWVLLSGGRNAGVMDAASRGAKEAKGLTVGILPTDDLRGMSEAVDIPIITALGQARNNINVLSSRIVFACGMGAGTASEIALAIKAKKAVVLLNAPAEGVTFFKTLDASLVFTADGPVEAIQIAREVLATQAAD